MIFILFFVVIRYFIKADFDIISAPLFYMIFFAKVV